MDMSPAIGELGCVSAGSAGVSGFPAGAYATGLANRLSLAQQFANERIGIVARAHTRDAAEYLRKAGANEVVIGEEELAIEMTGYALHRLGVSPQEIALIARGLRAR